MAVGDWDNGDRWPGVVEPNFLCFVRIYINVRIICLDIESSSVAYEDCHETEIEDQIREPELVAFYCT